MTPLFLSLALFSLPPHARAEAPTKGQLGQFACTAVYRSLDEKNNTIERTAEIPVKAMLGEQAKHMLNGFQGRTFLVTEDHGDLFAQIVTPGDLAKGLTARGTPDAQGRFHLAEVAGYTAYRIECGRI